jgi:hypothetical protein
MSRLTTRLSGGYMDLARFVVMVTETKLRFTKLGSADSSVDM